MFSEEQRTILLRYFDEHGMVSTHRKNHEIMARCAQEVGTSLDRIKVSVIFVSERTFANRMESSPKNSKT